ncbi:MAG TPA: protein kinase [Polyangiaceae bacterium]|nr:protein kinase [Polyangiaceae bacterium]
MHLVAHSYLGSLWIALDQRNGAPGRPVLLRRLQLQEDIPSEALQRMACAARDAMALSHENVLGVVEVLHHGEVLAVAYEYIEGEPLRSLQSWATQKGTPIPAGVCLRIIVDLLRGVRALHGTMAGWPSAPPFGGLSPDSVLVSRDGRTRLCDSLTASCATLLEGMGLNPGKLAYTAPEQAYATAPLAPSADVFSCGVLLWELLAGARLLTGPRATIEQKLLEHDWPSLRTQLEGKRELAPGLLQLVDRCLSSDASRRPQSPAALASELEQCGEELASLAEVAQFVAEIAGGRFDQRKMSVRSSLQLPAHKPSGLGPGVSSGNRRIPLPTQVSNASLRSLPAAGSSGAPLARIALAQRPAATEPPRPRLSRPLIPMPGFAGRPSSVSLPKVGDNAAVPSAATPPPPAPEASPAATPAAGDPNVVVVSESAAPAAPLAAPPAAPAVAPSASTPAPVAAPASVKATLHPPSSAPVVHPVGSTTMVGLAVRMPLFTPSAPFGSVPPEAPSNAAAAPATPAPSAAPAVVVIPPEPEPAEAPGSDPPVPVRSLVPTLPPPGLSSPPPSALPSSGPPRGSGWSQAPAPFPEPRSRARLASVLGSLALAASVAAVLWVRGDVPGIAASSLDAAALSARDPTPPGSSAAASRLPSSLEQRDAGAALPDRTRPAAPDAGREPEPEAPSLRRPRSRDDELLELFALERRTRLPSCAERLGASARQHTGNSPAKARAQLKAARRELMRGNNNDAQLLLCSATAHYPANLAAWQALAELALHLGDGALAQQAIGEALKRKPSDPTLLGIAGDAEALLGDLQQSRELWARSVSFPTIVAAPAAERPGKLAEVFGAIAARKLHGWGYGAALVNYRRAVVLSAAGSANAGTASAGMAESLRLLGQPAAALAWSDRATLERR